MPYVKTRDGVDLYVKDWGEGRPVILLHGWPLTADSWDDQALVLAQAGYRTIFYDRRGFGRSSQPWQGYDYDTFADDLATVIEATGARDAALIGFSMGGGEVARYFSRHGGRSIVQAGLVASIVPYLLRDDSNPDGVDESVFEEQIKAPIREDRAAFMASFAQNFYGVGFITSPVSQEVLDHFWFQAMQAGINATLACVDAFGRTDFRAELGAIDAPTLVIHGTGDKVVPIGVAGQAAAEGIRGASLLEYAGAPHGLNVTEKNQLTQDLLTFLRS